MVKWSKLPTFPVWLLSAITIVVVLVVGMSMSYFEAGSETDALEVGTYPDGARVTLEGEGTLSVHVGTKEMGPGWFGVGSWRYDVSFPDGRVLRDQGPLVIVNQQDLVVRCVAGDRSCEVSPLHAP